MRSSWLSTTYSPSASPTRSQRRLMLVNVAVVFCGYITMLNIEGEPNA